MRGAGIGEAVRIHESFASAPEFFIHKPIPQSQSKTCSLDPVQTFLLNLKSCSDDLIPVAMSTFSPVGTLSSNGMRIYVCVCVCVDGMNLKYAVRWHIHISVHSVLCQCYTQALAHTHPQTIRG